jgi:CRP/FNR family transcriptional regulator, cyclic AMP receptor protein
MSYIAQRLGTIDLFANLDESVLERVVASGATIGHRAGATIVEQGRDDRSLHLVLEGNAAVVVNGDQVGTLEMGDYFGETALIDGEPRSATIRAGDGGAKVFVISALAFEPLLADPAISRAMLVALTRRVRRLEAERA